MKRIVLFVILITIVMPSLIISVSAGPIGHKPTTVVQGKVFDAFTNESINRADVVVECYRDNKVNVMETTSLRGGRYIVKFSQDIEKGCLEGDTVKVSVTKDEFFGENTDIVDSTCIRLLDIAVVHVPMVPEFSILIASLTMISAVAIFFVVRRK